MSLHINRFIDKLAGADARNAKDVTLTIQEAKGLHQDITRLLATLERQQETQQKQQVDEVIEIRLGGSSFRDK